MAKAPEKKSSAKKGGVKSGSLANNNADCLFNDNFYIFQHLPSGLVIFDSKKIIRVNERAAKILGLGKTLAKNPSPLCLSDFIADESKALYKKLCGGKAVTDEPAVLNFNSAKKKNFPVEISIARLSSTTKKLFVAELKDAGSKLKKEAEQNNSRSDFNLLLSCIDEVVYYVDKTGPSGKGEIKYISEHIEDVVGIDAKTYKANAHRLLEFCHPDDVGHIIEIAERIRKYKKPQKFIYRFRHLKTGQYVWLEERVFPQFNNRKNHIGNLGVSRDITREKNFEQMLRQSEQKFRVIAESANDIIYRCNYYPQTYYEYMSPSVTKILGYSPEEFYSDPALGIKIMHPEDVSHLDFRGQTQAADTPVTKTSRYYHRNGNLVWLETNYSFLSDEDGKIISVQGISRDVTKEKESELKIQENERKFRLLAENALDIIFHYRFSGEPGYTYMSPSVSRILGYSPEEFYKDPFLGYKLLLPEDRPLMGNSEDNIRNKTVGSSEVAEMTLRYISRTGKIIWLQTTYSYVKDSSGRIIELEGISRDITMQKEGELALQESERKLNGLLSNLPGMAYRCLYNENWTMLFGSKGSAELTGYEPEEFLNDHVLPFSQIVHPEDILVGRQEIENAVKQRTSFEIEYRIIHKSGEVRWVWEKGEGVYGQGGQLLFIEGFINDISQRKKIEMELSQKWTNFQSLVETYPDGIFIQQQRNIIYANPAALRIMEIDDLQSVYQHNLLDFILPEYLNQAKERLERIMTGEKLDYLAEYKVRSAKGKILEVQVRSIPIIYNGRLALQIIFHDLTAQKQLEYQQIRAQLAEETNRKLQEEINERKKIEAELRHTQKFTRLLIDSSLDMICAADREGRIVEFNAAAQKAFGYTFEEVYGKQLTMLYANVKDRLNILNQMVEHETPFSGEVVNKRKNGETFISFLSATMLKNENGEIIGSMGVSRDITKLKMDEVQLRENEERYRAVFNQAFIGIARVDIYSGQYIEVNHRLCEMLGYQKEDLLKKTTYELTVKDDREKLATQHQIYDEGFFVQRKYIHRSGSVVYMNLSYSLVKDVAGNALYFIVVYDDITRNKLYEQEILNQTSKLKAIFESSSHLVWTVGRDFELTSFNTNFINVVKEKYNAAPTINSKMQDYLSEEEKSAYINEWEPKYNEVFKGNILKFEKADRNGKGENVYREVFLHPIYNNRNEVVEISCIAHDITERKMFERQITEQSAKLNAIFESTSHNIWTINRNLDLTSYNRNFAEEFRKLYNLEISLNMNIAGVMHAAIDAEQAALWIKRLDDCMKGNKQQFEIIIKGKSTDEKLYREIFLYPIFDENREVIEVSGIAQDITERKNYERQIIEQSAQLKAIFNSKSHIIWTVSKDFKVTSYNDNFFNRVNTNVDSFHKLEAGRSIINIHNPNYDAWMNHYRYAFEGQSRHFETQSETINHEIVWTEIFLEPIIDIDGKVIEVSGIAHDITQKKKAEEQIKLSLREKEVLLKEVHHRVKNNLQVISSILNLQSSYVKDQTTLMILKECQNRIKSMAFIHESLYQNKDFSNINFSEYIVMLSKNLLQSYGMLENRIRLEFDVEPVALNLDMSIPCGLIVNEIITNALKYAFPGEREGVIKLMLKLADERVHLEISDNGVGLPADLDFRNTESLGLQLVVTLVEQINGEIEVDVSSGTKFLINFTCNTAKY